jgi:phospholipid/cholesterol/gamma-HCH transport system permease protein
MTSTNAYKWTQTSSEWVLEFESEIKRNIVPQLWKEAEVNLSSGKSFRIVLKEQFFWDSSAIAFFTYFKKHLEESNLSLIIEIQDPKNKKLWESIQANLPKKIKSHDEKVGITESIGEYTVGTVREFRSLLVFLGEISLSLTRSIIRPNTIRWNEVLVVSEQAGVGSVPIICMIGFLLGLIMSFQSAIPMQRFGATIFVANLVGLSLFRELGPLMTAFILAGRSSSAFAAEIGTMKVSEEVDALTTMGLSPMQFLVIPRILASIFVTPLLTVVFNLFGLIGGAVVMHSFGFPYITFVNQLLTIVKFNDMAGGMFKSIVFGIIFSGVGCYKGLLTTTGAGAVGDSTTKAVVNTIILVSIFDGIFSVLFYYMGI